MIYLDNAATTAPSDLAINTFVGVSRNTWGNPSSTMYDPGVQARNHVMEAREMIADVLGCDESNIIFTSGSTEGANMVMKGFIPRGYEATSKILLTKMEHPCIYNTAMYLQSCGVDITFIKTSREGGIIYDSLEEELDRAKDYRRVLVCCMAVNNELGTNMRPDLVGDIVHDYPNAALMVDITQAISDPAPMPTAADYMIASAHKFGGLKGVGFVYAKDPKSLVPLIHGGHQESGFRAGTENVAAIYSMARQFESYRQAVEASDTQAVAVRHYLCGALTAIGGRINGRANPACNIVSATFVGADAQKIISFLAMKEIYISAGAACSTNGSEYSRVLKATGMSEEEMRGTIRISFSACTSKYEIDEFITALKECLEWSK